MRILRYCFQSIFEVQDILIREMETMQKAFSNLGNQGKNLRARYSKLHQEHKLGYDFQVDDQDLWNIQCKLQFEGIDFKIGTQASDNCCHIHAKTGVFGILVHSEKLIMV